MKRKVLVTSVLVLAVNLLCSCGTGSSGDIDAGDSSISYTDTNVKAEETYFEWDGNYITGITEEGKKQKNIVIPARCEGFSFDASFMNTEIENVSFEDDDDIELDSPFMDAENILTVSLPKNLTTISDSAFYGCENLKSIVIPSGVSVIEEYAFARCSSLSEVVFEGENLTVIGENSFAYCDSLKGVVFPEGVTTIGEYAFANCSSLANITFSSTVKTIEGYAFFECSSLENITLSPATSSIGSAAFCNTGLKEMHLPAEMEISSIDSTVFGMSAYDMTVYITKDSWCDKNQDVWDVLGCFDIKYE